MFENILITFLRDYLYPFDCLYPLSLCLLIGLKGLNRGDFNDSLDQTKQRVPEGKGRGGGQSQESRLLRCCPNN